MFHLSDVQHQLALNAAVILTQAQIMTHSQSPGDTKTTSQPDDHSSDTVPMAQTSSNGTLCSMKQLPPLDSAQPHRNGTHLNGTNKAAYALSPVIVPRAPGTGAFGAQLDNATVTFGTSSSHSASTNDIHENGLIPRELTTQATTQTKEPFEPVDDSNLISGFRYPKTEDEAKKILERFKAVGARAPAVYVEALIAMIEHDDGSNPDDVDDEVSDTESSNAVEAGVTDDDKKAI